METTDIITGVKNVTTYFYSVLFGHLQTLFTVISNQSYATETRPGKFIDVELRRHFCPEGKLEVGGVT